MDSAVGVYAAEETVHFGLMEIEGNRSPVDGVYFFTLS